MLQTEGYACQPNGEGARTDSTDSWGTNLPQLKGQTSPLGLVTVDCLVPLRDNL